MNIQKQFKIAFAQLNYTVINLKRDPDKFQKFLESIPEFFIERQDFPASQDEAKKIISNLPPNVIDTDKILLGINENDKLIGIISIADIAKASAFCPNEKYPDETCILIDIAKELQKSSHLEHSCISCHL